MAFFAKGPFRWSSDVFLCRTCGMILSLAMAALTAQRFMKAFFQDHVSSIMTALAGRCRARLIAFHFSRRDFSSRRMCIMAFQTTHALIVFQRIYLMNHLSRHGRIGCMALQAELPVGRAFQVVFARIIHMLPGSPVTILAA